MLTQAVLTALRQFPGLDPKAVLSVASAEGLSGAIGDGGHAFGPFQMNDAGGVLTGRFPGWSQAQKQAWASSPEGISEALKGMISAKGLTGRPAISAIVNNYERPADPGGEIARAMGTYGGQPSQGSTQSTIGAPSDGQHTGAPMADPRAGVNALLDMVMKSSQSLAQGQSGAMQPQQLMALIGSIAHPASTAPSQALQAGTGAPGAAQGTLAVSAAPKTDHDTAGLPNFPAKDLFGKPGESVSAPVGGKMVYVHQIQWDKGKRVGGTTAYLQGDNGKTYFLTHMTGDVPTGRVEAGQSIGQIAAVPGDWWQPHLHIGVHEGTYTPGGS